MELGPWHATRALRGGLLSAGPRVTWARAYVGGWRRQYASPGIGAVDTALRKQTKAEGEQTKWLALRRGRGVAELARESSYKGVGMPKWTLSYLVRVA